MRQKVSIKLRLKIEIYGISTNCAGILAQAHNCAIFTAVSSAIVIICFMEL